MFKQLLLRWRYSLAIRRMARLQKKAIWTQCGNPVELEQEIVALWCVIRQLQLKLGIKTDADLSIEG